jgi:hypothetical protein
LPYGAAILASSDTVLLAQWSPGDSTAFKGITRSTDGGETWNPRYTQSGVSVIRWESANTVYAGGPAGILVSEDAGSTWNTFNNGLPGTLVTDIAVNPYSDTLFVSILNYGVLKVWNFLVSLGSESGLPARFALEQNYPDPFNPSTTIRYTIAGSRENGVESTEVKLVLYDLLGREVAVLVNEMKAPGSYTAQLNASQLASGVYFYRLTARATDGGHAGTYIVTRKMVLMK